MLKTLLWALGAWTLPAILSTSLILVRPGADGRLWWPTLVEQLPNWWIWAALTPAVLSLAERVPIEAERLWFGVLAHLGLGTLVVVVYLTAQAPFAVLAEGRAVTLASWGNAVLGGLAFQFVTHYVIYFAIVGAGLALRATRILGEREVVAARLESQLAVARIESLRASLQPHFLFNTLNAISGLVREGRSNRAVEMIAGLSGLLRHTLDHVTSPEIPLHEELEALERYIEIEEVRFEDRLEIERSIDPALQDALVPALLLQPLVENAVHHGIGRRAGAGWISVEAAEDEGRLRLVVRDDGAGVPQGFDVDRSTGIGLGHTRKRLEELHGRDAQLEVRRVAPYGTEVSVLLPIRKANTA
ncbi:MAG: histidine kinase [Gemmatimonadota bacterium]